MCSAANAFYPSGVVPGDACWSWPNGPSLFRRAGADRCHRGSVKKLVQEAWAAPALQAVKASSVDPVVHGPGRGRPTRYDPLHLPPRGLQRFSPVGCSQHSIDEGSSLRLPAPVAFGLVSAPSAAPFRSTVPTTPRAGHIVGKGHWIPLHRC